MNDKLVKKLQGCKKIEAIALGGSRATNNYDENSDYDYYVYVYDRITENERKNLLDEFVSYMEYSNEFWELEDDGTFINGIDVEFIYRKVDDLEQSMNNLLIKGHVGMGYTTCFVDNLLNSKILFDKDGRVAELREKYRKLLTNQFYDKIIYNNMPILMDKMPSLFYQIEKSMKRNDIFSMNHRSTAFFEMYFDILFALNRQTHPGEKRLLELASKLDVIPINMKSEIENYFNILFEDKTSALKTLRGITMKLYCLLKDKGYELTIDSYKNRQ